MLNIMLIGQGPGNDLILHEKFHITILADGTVTSFHDNSVWSASNPAQGALLSVESAGLGTSGVESGSSAWVSCPASP